MPIRAATPADIPALLVLERESATAAHWPEQQYQALFNPEPRRLALLAEENSLVQGFLVARTLDQEWEIENVVVSVSLRRLGVGSSLLRAVVDVARQAGARAMFLEVRETNAPARGLYEKCSFRQSGRRAGYYRNPDEDALIYRLDLL